MTHEEIKALVGKHVTELGEHFDSVLVLVTCPHPDNSQTTMSFERGSGNFYAQLGQVTEWLAMQQEYQCAEARRRDDTAQEGRGG